MLFDEQYDNIFIKPIKPSVERTSKEFENKCYGKSQEMTFKSINGYLDKKYKIIIN